MDPNGNLYLKVKPKIKTGSKGEDDGTMNHGRQQTRETTTTKPTEQAQGTSSGNDSLIIIPDTPSPIFSRFIGKRGKHPAGRNDEISNDSRGYADSKTNKSKSSEFTDSLGSSGISSHNRAQPPREPMLTPEKQSSSWRQNHFEETNANGRCVSPKVSSFRKKFLDAQSKIALSPGKVKISPYIPSHGVHFKTALQEMMERKSDNSRNESNHRSKKSERSVKSVSRSSEHSRTHRESLPSTSDDLNDSAKADNHQYSVIPVIRQRAEKTTQGSEDGVQKEIKCTTGRRKSEDFNSPGKSKRARLDGGFSSKRFYTGYHRIGLPSESSDSGSDDSDFEAISSQTLKAMIDCSSAPNQDLTLPKNLRHDQDRKLQDESIKCANNTESNKYAPSKPHSSHASSLHDITSSESVNHNLQGHVYNVSTGARKITENIEGNKAQSSRIRKKSDQTEKMSSWFDDGFTRVTEPPMEESRSHSRQVSGERRRLTPHAALEGKPHKNKRTHLGAGLDQRQKTPDGSAGQPIVCDDVSTPQRQIEQVEGDEELAKKLQEQMDMEFAMSLQDLENQPPVYGAQPQPQHGIAQPIPVFPTNRGLTAGWQGRWVSPPRRLTTSRYPDLDEVEALLRDLDEPEERLLQNSPPTRTTRNGVRSQQGQHFRDEFAHFNNSLLSMLGGDTHFISPPVARNSRSRRRGQRRNANPRGFDMGNPADGNDYEDLLNLAEMLGDVKNKGLTEAQSSRLPIRTYQTNGEKQSSEECLICMSEYDQGDRLKMLPCFHEFHSQCIDKWITGNASCPVCRVEVQLTVPGID